MVERTSTLTLVEAGTGPRQQDAGTRGQEAAAEVRALASPSMPLEVAFQFLAAEGGYSNGALALRHWQGGWWRWLRSEWASVEEGEMRKAIYEFTKDAVWYGSKGERLPWAPTRNKVANVMHALEAVCNLPARIEQPAWVVGQDPTGGHRIVACRNGLLDVRTRELLPSTARFFNVAAVPFDYEPDAPLPANWLAFLDDLFGDDQGQLAVLQEFTGYVISGRTDMHKMLLVVGPTRAGKGVMARTMRSLIGWSNTCGPTLSSLSGEFGLAPLLDKSLAVVSDARLAGRGTHVTVERLLSVSGEDFLTVNRKYRDQVTAKLPTRFLICSNELPRLGDASAAIAGRFITLLLTRSWLGREDRTIEERIDGELPAIFNWALEGLARLDRQGRFSEPQSSIDAYVQLQDLASPVGAFVRDWCQQDPDYEIAVDDLYAAWKLYAEEHGEFRKTSSAFGADLRAVAPQVRKTRVRDDGDRIYRYAGIKLTPEAHSKLGAHAGVGHALGGRPDR